MTQTVDEPGGDGVEQELLRAMYEADTTADLIKVMCRELVRLRTELALLHDGNGELHVRRIVVGDGPHGEQVRIDPTAVVVCTADGRAYAHLACNEIEGAEVAVADHRAQGDSVAVWVGASSCHGYEEQPAAYVKVNGVELAVPAVTS